MLTPAERTRNFSQLLAQGIQLHYPLSTTPISGNVIPSSLISPQALAIVNSTFYPQPVNNALVNNSVNTTHSYTNQDQGDLRVDWNASEKDRVFGRYSQAYLNSPITNSQQLLYNSTSVYPIHNGVVDYTRTFSPSFVNDLRAGVNYDPAVSGIVTGNGISAASVGIPGVPSTVLPAFNFTAGNLSGTNFGNPDNREASADTVIQVGDTAILTKGTHTIHTGFQIDSDPVKYFLFGRSRRSRPVFIFRPVFRRCRGRFHVGFADRSTGRH